MKQQRKYMTPRSRGEISHQIATAKGMMERCRSAYPNMTYEEGVIAALDWVTGETDDKPDGE